MINERAFSLHLQALCGSDYAISGSVDFPIAYKIQGFRYPLSTETQMPWYEERYQLLLEYFISFLQHIRVLGRAWGGIYEPLAANTVPFPQMMTIKLHIKCLIWGIRSAWDMICWSARKYIYCFWSISSSSLNALERWERLLTASTSPLWFTPCHYHQIGFQILKFSNSQDIVFGVSTLSTREMGPHTY